MKVISFLLAAFASTFLLSSCGGSGGSSPSPFQGDFSGNWTSDNTDVGTASVHITKSGSFTGDETDTTISLHGTVVGHLTNGGVVNGTVTPDGGSAINTTGQFHISQDGNTITGSLNYNGSTYSYTLNRN